MENNFRTSERVLVSLVMGRGEVIFMIIVNLSELCAPVWIRILIHK